MRTVVTREVEWDEDEQAWMLALHRYRAQLCPAGHYLPRSAAPEAEDAYRAGEPMRCFVCTAIGEAAEGYRDSPHPQALLWNVELTGR